LALVIGFLPHDEPQESSLTAALSSAQPAHLGSRRVEHEQAALEPGFPADVRLLGEMNGLKAIAALGDRLPEVAAFYGWTPEKLEEHLRADPELHVTPSGQLLYACGLNCAHGDHPQATEPAMDTASIAPTDPSPYDTSQAFLLHSRPGANRVIYLDFDGHTDNTPGYWKAGAASPAYNISGNNPAIFEDDERNNIIEIWQRVAEDYAMFDIDVTTEEPNIEALRKTSSSDAQFGMRCVIGGSGSIWYGANVGGVALSGTFDANQDVPCWVFPVGGAGFGAKNAAEAASHEVGHTLGLGHDGVEGGSGATTGQGNWAPIMGVSYYEPITQWSKGEYANPNNTQDDLAVMLTQGAVYRPDDHGGTLATATKLSADSSSASVSGVIGRNTDLDFFRLDAVTGTLVINIKPTPLGANLRLEVKLYDSGGVLLQTITSADVSGASSGGTRPVTLSRTVSAGVFYVSVDGIGNGDPLTTGYTDYASLGQYTGSVTGVVPGGFTWTTATAGTKQWNTAGNWASGTVPNAAGISARVNNDISGAQTIQLTGVTTVGSLDLGDSNSTHAFTLTPSGGSLVFNNSGITANLSKTSGGNDIISAPVALVDHLLLTQSASGTLAFSGGISGAKALTKAGAGTVVFASANSYTGVTTLDDGLLRLDNASGLPGGIDNTVGAGEGVLAFEGGVLGLATGDFTRQMGTGTGQLDWVNGSGGFAAFGADRQVRLNNATTAFSWGSTILGTGNILMLSHSTATHMLDFRNGISFAGQKRTVHVEDGVAAVDATLSGKLTGGTSSGFTKTGPGVLSLTNATNDYTGVTTVADGLLRLQNAASLPSGNLELTGGGVLGLGAADFTARTIGTGANMVQWLGSGGFAAFGATRAVRFTPDPNTSINWTDSIETGRVLVLGHDTADATLNWQQRISLAGNLRIVQVNDGSAAIDAMMSGIIAGGSSGTSNIFSKSGAGTLAFTAQNTYWGETIINSGTLMIGDGGMVGGISQNTPIITVEPGAVLAVNRSNTLTQGTNALKVAITGDGGFKQAGSGNTVLMLANTYIGPTTIDVGTLTLGAAGVLPDASEVSIGNATLTAGSFSETAGRLVITGAATINLGTGSALSFANSSAIDWTGGTLNLTGTFVLGGPGGSLRFGTSNTGLTSTQLAKISAAGFTGFGLDANGYLTATAAVGYSNWKATNSTAQTIDLDHDSDGVGNGIEYFLGGHTNTTGFTALPHVANTAGTLSITWPKHATYTGTYGSDFWVETSSTLTGVWTPAALGAGANQVDIITIPGNVKYTFPAGTKNFARLKVTGP
jgi:autotransporter-associated beta strand protein